jgi:hypothetical protein
MDDWRNRINHHLDEQERQRNQNKQDRLREEQKYHEKRQAEEKRKEQADYDRKLVRLQKKFKCHVCNTPSQGPKVRTLYRTEYRGYGEVGSNVEVESGMKIFWNTPGDLNLCEHHQKWTCRACLHRGICKKYSEGL